MYINDIQAKQCDPCAKPTIIKETVATALCDGNNGLGAVIGKLCMEIAINKAKTAGIGMVVTKGEATIYIPHQNPTNCYSKYHEINCNFVSRFKPLRNCRNICTAGDKRGPPWHELY